MVAQDSNSSENPFKRIQEQERIEFQKITELALKKTFSIRKRIYKFFNTRNQNIDHELRINCAVSICNTTIVNAAMDDKDILIMAETVNESLRLQVESAYPEKK